MRHPVGQGERQAKEACLHGQGACCPEQLCLPSRPCPLRPTPGGDANLSVRQTLGLWTAETAVTRGMIRRVAERRYDGKVLKCIRSDWLTQRVAACRVQLAAGQGCWTVQGRCSGQRARPRHGAADVPPPEMAARLCSQSALHSVDWRAQDDIALHSKSAAVWYL